VTSDANLWIVTAGGVDLSTTPNGGSWLIRYNLVSGALVTYTVPVGGMGVPDRLLVAQDGTLWGIGMEFAGSAEQARKLQIEYASKPRWLLSRYDAATDRFVEIHDADGLVQGDSAREIFQDKEGDLWLLIHAGVHDNVVRYNPVTNQATQLPLEPQLANMSLHGIDHIVLAPDDSLWFTSQGTKAINWKVKVLRYDFNTEALQDYGYPLGEHSVLPNLYFDKAGRLWTTSTAWLDLQSSASPQWHFKTLPDVFLVDYIDPVKERHHFEWLEPDQIFESSDGMFWFSATAGLVKYDWQKDKWYLVGSVGSAVAEDRHGNIWTAWENQIYQYKPQP